MHRIIENLWQSGTLHFSMTEALEAFDSVEVVATEFAPLLGVRWTPINGGTTAQLDRVLEVAARVREDMSAGKKVLVACSCGLNRSGAVTAIVLRRMGMSPTEAIDAVRSACGDNALRAATLVDFVLNVELPSEAG